MRIKVQNGQEGKGQTEVKNIQSTGRRTKDNDYRHPTGDKETHTIHRGTQRRQRGDIGDTEET